MKRGKSKAFLRALRKKYGLGEFRKSRRKRPPRSPSGRQGSGRRESGGRRSGPIRARYGVPDHAGKDTFKGPRTDKNSPVDNSVSFPFDSSFDDNASRAFWFIAFGGFDNPLWDYYDDPNTYLDPGRQQIYRSGSGTSQVGTPVTVGGGGGKPSSKYGAV